MVKGILKKREEDERRRQMERAVAATERKGRKTVGTSGKGRWLGRKANKSCVPSRSGAVLLTFLTKFIISPRTK